MERIVLASKSKRRSTILKNCGISHRVVPSGIREARRNTKRPDTLVMLNARRKVEAVARKTRKGIIIGVDTLVLFKKKLVGKPRSKTEARKMLSAFSGNRIIVYSGICVIDLENKRVSTGFDKTSLYIRSIPRRDIDKYFKLLGPYDKAGGFSIEGVGSIVFDNIRGSYFNVLGLPMGKLEGLFHDIGLDLLNFVKQ